MQQFHAFFKQLVLAFVLVLGSSAAIAGPTYTVTLNTSAFTGSALLDLSFGSLTGAAPVAALVSGFSSNIGAGAGAVVTLDNSDPPSSVSYLVTLGQTFSFNVSFGDSFTGGDAALFAVVLFDEISNTFIGADGAVAEFNLLPSDQGLPQAVFSGVEGLASVSENVTAVPEPSQLLLMLTALAMLGFMLRKRSPK